MTRFAVIATSAGILLIGLLVASSGFGEVAAAVAASGWAAALIVLLRALALAADGAAWRLLLPRPARPGLALAAGLRVVREGINMLLPVAQVGGDLVGARLLALRGVDGALAGASVIVDVMIQAVTQFLFAVIGLAVLTRLGGGEGIVRVAAAGLMLAALALGGFFLAQRRQAARLLQTLLDRIAGGREWLAIAAVDRLYHRLADIHGNRRGMAACAGIHMGVWLFGASEVWVALASMGHPVTYAEALVIESLGQAVKGAAFAVPGALGVQEGGFIALAAIFGIPAEAALALSLVKRLPDVVLGIPALIAWHVIEGRRAMTRGAAAKLP